MKGWTREVWQQRLGRDLIVEETRQTAANIGVSFSIPAECLWAELPEPANDKSGDATFEAKGGRHDG